MSPIIQHIKDAKSEFFKKYGFSAERMHVSRGMEVVLSRWADKNVQYPADVSARLQGAEVLGLQVMRMTKNTPHTEFYLVAERDKTLYTLNVRIERDTSKDDDSSQPPVIQLCGDLGNGVGRG